MKTQQLNKIKGQHVKYTENGESYLYPKKYIWHIPHDLRGDIEVGDIVEVFGSLDLVKVIDVFHAEEPKNNQTIYRLVRKSDPQADFSYRLKKLRKEKRLTQQDLAQSLGVSIGTISAWELRRSKPQKKLYPKIEEILGIELKF